MSELTLFLIRIAYLAILWIFVLSAISVIRSDMFGARVARRRAGEAGRAEARAAPAQAGQAPARAPPPTSLIVDGANKGERADARPRRRS